LEQARSFGDFLVVAVTKDKYVGKPGRPIIPQEDRLEMIKGLHCVSQAGLVRDSLEALRKWKPSVFVKGHDYKEKGLLAEEREYCYANDIEIKFTGPNPQTTSGIVKKICRAYS
jgi:bifunctional ADP-heptose synthase (sugar kinase/adenylyltransferase)